MERLHGVPLTDLAAIRSMTSADPEQTLITALNTWFGSVLGCETFHADVHAGGNLQVYLQCCHVAAMCTLCTLHCHLSCTHGMHSQSDKLAQLYAHMQRHAC